MAPVPAPTEVPVIDFITPPRTSLIGDLKTQAGGEDVVSTVMSLLTGDDPPAVCAESDQQERYRATILMERGYGATHTFEYYVEDGEVESVDAEAVPDAPSPYVIYLGQDSITTAGGVGESYYAGQTNVDFCFGIRIANRPICLQNDTIIFDFEIDATTGTIHHSTRPADGTVL